MRVLQIMTGAEHGGAETFFVDLVTALHRAGLEQRVLIKRHAARAARLREGGVVAGELPFNRWFDIGTAKTLRREIAAFRPDIVQTWMSRASSTTPSGPFVHVGWLGGYYPLKYFRRCHRLIGVTNDIVAHAVKSGWPEQRAHYLPTFSSDAPEPPARRSDLDTPEDAPLILALGRLHPNKAFDILLQAMEAVPQAYLWLAGEGPLRAKLEAQARQLNLMRRVRFLGWRPDRGALLASCDICVMPSRVEPFGTVMIEAWAYRKPLIAAAALGPRGLIKDGENGLLVPCDDVPALAAAILRLIAQPALAQHIAELGRRHFELEYTEPIVVSRYLDFYRRILERPTESSG
jgi:glycosyltransferase involved in cell wall biosynthesis